ncbi:MAG: LruC domain-containing protein [Bacteroidota bacterium]
MKAFSLATIFTLLLLLFSSCSPFEDRLGPQEVNSSREKQSAGFNALNTPSNFDFNTTHEVFFDLTARSQAVMAIYSDYPSEGGALLYRFNSDENGQLSRTLVLPTHMEEVYISAQTSMGEFSDAKVKVEEDRVHHDFTYFTFDQQPSTNRVSSSCSGASFFLTTSSNPNTSISGNMHYAIEAGQVYTGAITMNGNAKLSICGVANLSSLIMNGNNEVFVNGELIVSSINKNGTSGEMLIAEEGKVEVTNTLSYTGAIENKGEMTVAGDFNYTHGSLGNYNNFGSLSISNNMNLNGNFFNHYNGSQSFFGNVDVQGTLNINGSGSLVNRCFLEIGDNFNVGGNIELRSGYVKVGNTFTANSTMLWTVDEQRNLLIEAQNFMGNSQVNVNGYGPTFGNANEFYMLIKVGSSTTLNSGFGFNGNNTTKVYWCDENGIETDNSSVPWGSMFLQSCAVSIPTGQCMPSSAPIDSDNDSIPDHLDDFPSDPNKAFSSYFPSAETFGTYLLEDLYPHQGDYDFNDMVVKYQYEHVTNSANEYVEANAKFAVAAIGAKKENGFGIKLENVQKNQVDNVSGYEHVASYINLASNKLESGSDDAVVIVYDNVSQNFDLDGGLMYNVRGNALEALDTTYLKITFTNGNAIQNLSFKPLFIIDQDRGHEVQLKGETPTNMMNAAILGTHDDGFLQGGNNYFESAQGQLPWVLDITSEFAHMQEAVDITQGYLKLESWAISGGTDYLDWAILDKASYRNEALVIK